jgi:hypothetical protein
MRALGLEEVPCSRDGPEACGATVEEWNAKWDAMRRHAITYHMLRNWCRSNAEQLERELECRHVPTAVPTQLSKRLLAERLAESDITLAIIAFLIVIGGLIGITTLVLLTK